MVFADADWPDLGGTGRQTRVSKASAAKTQDGRDTAQGTFRFDPITDFEGVR